MCRRKHTNKTFFTPPQQSLRSDSHLTYVAVLTGYSPEKCPPFVYLLILDLVL